jgi:hypothetical protein
MSKTEMLMMFWNSTGLEAPVEKHKWDDFIKAVKESADIQIAAFLNDGETHSSTAQILSGQLTSWENRMIQLQKEARWAPNHSVGTKEYMAYLDEVARPSKISGFQMCVIWFINIAILLKMGVIKNDDSNGWLRISKNYQTSTAVVSLNSP